MRLNNSLKTEMANVFKAASNQQPSNVTAKSLFTYQNDILETSQAGVRFEGSNNDVCDNPTATKVKNSAECIMANMVRPFKKLFKGHV